MKFRIYKSYKTVKGSRFTHRMTYWRWQLKARNGKIVDASTEGFSSWQAARNNARLTRDGLIEAEL